MIYPQYTLIHAENTIVLTLMHDENHPVAIAIFLKDQYKTAEYIQTYLNDTKFGL